MKIKIFYFLLVGVAVLMSPVSVLAVADCLCRSDISKIKPKDYGGFVSRLVFPVLYGAPAGECKLDKLKSQIGENKYNVICSRCFMEGSKECPKATSCTACSEVMSVWNTTQTKLLAEYDKLISKSSASTGDTGTDKKDASAVKLENPLQSGATDMPTLIGTIIKGLLGVMGGLMLLMIVWGGFQWLTAAGSPERVKSGTQTIIWAVIGAAITLSSYVVLNIILKFLSS